MLFIWSLSITLAYRRKQLGKKTFKQITFYFQCFSSDSLRSRSQDRTRSTREFLREPAGGKSLDFPLDNVGRRENRKRRTAAEF